MSSVASASHFGPPPEPEHPLVTEAKRSVCQPFLMSHGDPSPRLGPGAVLEPIGPGEWIAFDLAAEACAGRDQ